MRSKMEKMKLMLKMGKNDPRLFGRGLKILGTRGFGGVKDELNSHLAHKEEAARQAAHEEALRQEELAYQRAGYEQAEREIRLEEMQVFSGKILFSILMPVFNVEIRWLDKAIKSIRQQTYQNWELCIADDGSTDETLRNYLAGLQDEKIKVTFCPENGGISVATNQAAQAASGEYLVLMDNDDVIAPNALAEFYFSIEKDAPDVLYSDQDMIDANDQHSCPLYKPDWSPDLLRSQMYIGHLLGFKKSLFEKIGGFRSEFDGSQDYDLMLRLSECTQKIAHIPKVLYSWRSIATSTAKNPEAKPYAQEAGRKALQSHLDRTLGEGMATAAESEYLFVYDVQYLLAKEPLVSIIMPTKDHMELVEQAVASIVEQTTYRNYEILILDNNSCAPDTAKRLASLMTRYACVCVEKAEMSFNWSKINNYGMQLAKGEVFVFLNNDIKIITPEWLTRLVEQAVRPEVGVVGGLLLYEDGTIQHGGVVVGMRKWAGHVYNGMQPEHVGTPYISPMVTRNVMACTGACLGVSRATVEQIGAFDEAFIICGSDVEMGIRAHEQGLYNIYSPHIKMYHYESKTRDDYTPPIDHCLSSKIYYPYLKKGDPFYNIWLDDYQTIPTVKQRNPLVENLKQELEEQYNKRENIPTEYRVNEVNPYRFRTVRYPRRRLNLLVPSINQEHVFGGIATALKFFNALCTAGNYDRRLIVIDYPVDQKSMDTFGKGYTLVPPEENSLEPWQVVSYSPRNGSSIPVSEQDYFVFTGWWTAYCVQEAYERLEAERGIRPNLFVYLIQDYEPGFYKWSSQYVMADATYRHPYPSIAVFNSELLRQHFENNGYQFYRSFSFDPVLSGALKKELMKLPEQVEKKKQIVIYGRPGTPRNAFELAVASLQLWTHYNPDAENWRIVSAGEQHPDINLGNGIKIESVGKVTLAEYAKMMQESYAGISLMVSPHPSYPPLEMAVFGVKVITNTFLNKDLASFHDNIVTVNQIRPGYIADALREITNHYQPQITLGSRQIPYIETEDIFGFVAEIEEILGKERVDGTDR